MFGVEVKTVRLIYFKREKKGERVIEVRESEGAKRLLISSPEKFFRRLIVE